MAILIAILLSEGLWAMLLITRFGAEIELSEEDIAACRMAGNDYFESEVEKTLHPDRYVRPSRQREDVREIRFLQRFWNHNFDNIAEAGPREIVFANILEFRRGWATCSVCDDIFASDSLCIEERRLDGIYQQRFICPDGHVLWITHENRMGEFSETGWYGWRPIRRANPWLFYGWRGQSEHTEYDGIP